MKNVWLITPWSAFHYAKPTGHRSVQEPINGLLIGGIREVKHDVHDKRLISGIREVKHDVHDKRQMAKMKLLPSLFSCVYSRVTLFVFAIVGHVSPFLCTLFTD